MSEHLSTSDLELFVIDGLDAVRAAAVEEHVATCDVCSAALAKEAALEIAFEEIARAPAVVAKPAARPARPRPAPPARLGLAVVTAGTLSLAAAWMLVLMPATRGAPQATVSTSGDTSGYTATASDATTAALDARSLDPLDGG